MPSFTVPAAAAGLPSRQDLETMIEIAIAILDYLDDDPDLEQNGDLEPSLGAQVLGAAYDAELDESEREFSLGSLDSAIDQTRWAAGAQGDYEGPDSDLEESLGWSNPLGARIDLRSRLIVERVPDRQIARRPQDAPVGASAQGARS